MRAPSSTPRFGETAGAAAGVTSELGTCDWLLHPLTLGGFAEQYLERQHALIARADPEYFAGLLSWRDLDQVLGTHGVRHPDVLLVQKGRDIPASDYTTPDGIIDARQAIAQYNRGATLIFGQLQTRVPALARLCTDLTKAFSSKVQTNIYLTPPDAQGFEIHWDTHDVFVLQISGTKHWRLYGTPIELPLRGQVFEANRQEGGPTTAEFDLHAGDVLYVPRGLMHSAHSTADHSLHITVGLISYTWTDLLVDAVCAAGLEDVALREALPLGFAHEDFPAEARARLLEEKLAILIPRLRSDQHFRSAIDDLVSKHQPMFENLLEQQIRRQEIDRHSALRSRPDAIWMLVPPDAEGDQASIHFNGTQIDFPAFVLPALTFIKAHQQFRIDDLPACVDEAGHLALVQRLIQEGLVEQL